QQGQQGSQGSQGADGQNGGGQAAGGSPRNGGGAYGDGRNWGGAYNGGYRDGYHQTRRNPPLRPRLPQVVDRAPALRRELQNAGVPARDLDDIIRDLERFDADRIYADPRGLEQLQASAIDKLKKFEFGLRRKTEAGNDSLSLSGSDQVPDGFRQAIE